MGAQNFTTILSATLNLLLYNKKSSDYNIIRENINKLILYLSFCLLDMERDTKITIDVVVVAVIILAPQLFFLWAPDAAAQSLEPSPEQQQERATDRFDTVQVRILTTDADLDWTGYIMCNWF